MKKKKETNIFFRGRLLMSKKGRVELARIELGTLKLVDTQAAPAIFV